MLSYRHDSIVLRHCLYHTQKKASVLYEMSSSITRKIRTRVSSCHYTRRKKHRRMAVSSIQNAFLYGLVCCISTICMPEQPIRCLPDISYKASANELLETLYHKFIQGTLTDSALTYMILGYESILNHTYKEAIVYFNIALSFPYL